MQWYHPSPPSAPIRPVPWLSMPAREYLDNLVQPDWEVIEHGGGGSTVWFSTKCARVVTVESNLKWFTKLAQLLLPNVMLVYGREVPQLASQFDLVLIDGEPVADRALWIAATTRLIKPGGWVVLDNANRPEYATERKHLQVYAAEFKTFDGNEPHTQYLVTEFYRLPETEGLKLPSAEGAVFTPIFKSAVSDDEEARRLLRRKKKGGE